METRRVDRRVDASMVVELADTEGHRDRYLNGDEGGSGGHASGGEGDGDQDESDQHGDGEPGPELTVVANSGLLLDHHCHRRAPLLRHCNLGPHPRGVAVILDRMTLL